VAFSVPIPTEPSHKEGSAAMAERPGVIRVDNVSKRHGDRLVLDGVSFGAEPGRITAFLGPNGAGKSSTLRILMGLDRPTSGVATFDGKPFSDLLNPLTIVGSVFDGIGGTRSRRVTTHLAVLAQANGLPSSRVAEVVATVGLAERAKSRLGSLSLGEGQRLGLAAALLGDPQFLVLDEPTNGLDPGGIRWFRQFLREQADQGKTVLLSSHILSEVEAVADEIVIIDQGKIVTSGDIRTVLAEVSTLEDLFFSVTNG
jgi:ABC-2 type transport system ATP-binding protein